jgi:uncharacterized protein
MKSLHFAAKTALAACALSMAAAPLFADVKTGVDAWTRGDFALAVKEWRDPAIKGDADAQFNLGQAYKLGRGVKADLDVAADWYLRAARQGHIQASDSYGHLMHYRGKVAEALPYLQTSSDRGEPRSQYLLGTELFNGTNIGKDWVRAYALMTRASSSGLAAASRSLAQMDQYIPLDQRQRGVAMAGDLEKRAGQSRNQQMAGFDINTKPPVKVAMPVDVPPSSAGPSSAGPGFPGTVPSMPGAPNTIEQPAARPATRPAPVRTASTAVASNSNWRIQLGAFGNEANAKNLWNTLEGKVAGLANLTPILKRAGAVTRLQAEPFASKAAAEAMCSKVKATGQACLVTSN